MRVQRGVIYYSPRCLCVCRHYNGSWPFQIEITHTLSRPFSNAPNTRMPPPRCPWATRPIHARCPKRLPLVLGVVGAEVVCSKSKLSTTHNHHHRHRRHRRRRRRRRHHHHHHLFFQLLLKAFIVARVIFKRLNPGAAEDGAEDVLVVRRHLPAAEPMPPLPLGHVRDKHVKDAAQEVAEDVPQDVAQDLAFGARAARALPATPPPPPPPSLCSSR